MKHRYKDWTPNTATLQTILQANGIIAEYQADGFKLTLRQLYYQLVARGIIANNDKQYDRLGSILNDARLAGLVDWEAIEDRGRFIRQLAQWESPSELVEACASQFRVDLWKNQPKRVEVWVEKDALIGVVQRTAERYGVPCLSCRGYASVTALYEAAQRFRKWEYEEGQGTVIIHLGDHDPSGIDMTRDIDDRLRLFGVDVDVNRVALNMDQVRQYDPPPNPAKVSDSRYEKYVAEYGDESWELDALEPRVMDGIVATAIEELIDEEEFEKRQALGAAGRKTLKKVAAELSAKKK